MPRNKASDFGILSQGRKRRFAPVGAAILVREVPAKAVATMHGARRRRDQESAAAVLPDDRGRAGEVPLAQRIDAESRAVPQYGHRFVLRRRRQYLAQQQIVGIVPPRASDDPRRTRSGNPPSATLSGSSDNSLSARPSSATEDMAFFSSLRQMCGCHGEGVGGHHLFGYSAGDAQL